MFVSGGGHDVLTFVGQQCASVNHNGLLPLPHQLNTALGALLIFRWREQGES